MTCEICLELRAGVDFCPLLAKKKTTDEAGFAVESISFSFSFRLFQILSHLPQNGRSQVLIPGIDEAD